MSGKSARRIGVAELAYFAARPQVYVDRKGRAWNEERARQGSLSHRNHFKAPWPVRIGKWIILGFITAASLYLIFSQ